MSSRRTNQGVRWLPVRALRRGIAGPRRAAWRGLRALVRGVRKLYNDTDTWVVSGIVLIGVGVGTVHIGAGLATAGALTFGLGIWMSLPGRGT